ncbi:unnamed protein product [Adineta ricciae]|uniref:Uncharacterized protein n=1 Tax=Adineta ricciae TaxID=249248 RepID=A0A813R2L6_ADIRI|nr:unnamed protein product [Adineta ricciae]CAF1037987.1 unnamed protein product [Adineta ricciae]
MPSSNQIVIEAQNCDSKDSQVTRRTSVKQADASFNENPKKKVLCVILLVVIVSMIVVGVLIPTIILKRSKIHSSITTTTVTTTTTTVTTTTTTTATTTTEPDPIPLDAVRGNVIGIYNTSVGSNSKAATPGREEGKYVPEESPEKVFDGLLSTKYLSFGPCYEGHRPDSACGLYTGLYLELERGPTLVNGLKICTANDSNVRDPTAVSLEGSNAKGNNLTLGSSWILLYKGTSGIVIDPGRGKCGSIQYFNNTVEYSSYRFLVSGNRKPTYCVQYSEVKLYSL